MASTDQYPALADLMARAPLRQPATNKSGILGPGLSAAVDQFQANTGVGIRAVGDFIGSQTVSDIGAGIAERNFAEMARGGRADLESFPSDDLTKAPAWLGYQLAKQVPNLALTALAYRFGGPLAARYMPAAAAQAGAAAPRWIGGGGLRAGMTAAETAAANARGAGLAAGVLAQAPINYPQAVGSLYNEAIESGNAGPGKALLSLAGGVPYSLAEGFEPATLGKALARTAEKGFFKSVAAGAVTNAAQETLTEGAQTAMEQAFRPDLSVRERLANVVSGAVTGGVLGGVFGGVSGGIGGMRQLKTSDPATIDNPTIAETVDRVLAPVSGASLPLEVDEQQANMGVGQEVFDARTRELRPFAGPETAELEQRLAEVEQRGLLTREMQTEIPGMAPPAASRQDMVLAQLLRQELGRRAAEQPVVTPNAAADPSTQPMLNDLQQSQQVEMFPEQRGTPAPEDMVVAAQRRAAQAKAAQYGQSLLGSSKAQGAAELLARPVRDELDVAANIVEAINTRDGSENSTGTLPIYLKKAAVQLGVMDTEGRLRSVESVQTELAEAQAVAEDRWQRAKTMNVGQGEAQAAQRKVAKLKDTLAQVSAIQTRLAERASQNPPVAPLSESQRLSTPEETVATLATAPVVPIPPTMRQMFDVRSSGAPLPVDVVEPPAPVRDASGMQYQSLAERFRSPVAPTLQPISTAPVAPSSPLAQGSRFSPAGVATNPELPTKIVTAESVAKARAEARAAAKAAGKGSRKRSPAGIILPPTYSQMAGTSFASAAPVPPRPATDIQPGTMRGQAVSDLVRAKLERVANTDEVGRPMRQAASEALAALDGFQPGADTTAARVLAEYAALTGDIVFSQKNAGQRTPPMTDEAFEQALKRAAASLPPVARSSIYVVNNASELPDVVIQAAAMQGMHPTDIRGVLYDGSVYVVQDQIGSEAELQEVIDHEVFGHGGARALLGDKRGPIMQTVWRMMGGMPGLTAMARKFGVEKALAEYIPGVDPKTGVPTRDLTPAEQVRLVDELLAQVQGSKGKLGLMLRAWVSRFKSFLINTLRDLKLDTLADRLDTFDANDLAEMLTRMRQAVESGASMKGEGVEFLRLTPQGMNESLQNASKTADNVWNWVSNASQSETRLKLNEFHLYTSTISHIVSSFGRMFETKVGNPLRKFWDAHVMRGVAEQRMAHAVAKSYNDFESLLSSNPKAAEQMNSLMRYTFDMIDPRKPWSDHTWLRDTKNPANEARSKAKVAEANKLYRALNERNNPEGNRVLTSYQNFIDTNEGMHFAQQAMSLFNLMTSDKEIAQAMKDDLEANYKNPMDRFLQKTDTYDNTKATRDFWETETKALVEKAEAYLASQNALANTVDKTSAAKIEKNTSALKARLRTINSEQQSMKQAPYFHLGRFGDWVLGFHIPVKNGAADPAAMEAIAARFQKAGIEGIEIPKDATRANAFIRFESMAEREAAKQVALELAKDGFVLNTADKPVTAFKRSDDTAMQAFDISKMPQWAQGLMDKIRAKEFGKIEGLSEDEKRLVSRLNSEFERHVSQYFLDLLPDTSITKVMVQRNNVPGFSTDMMRSQLFRAQIAGRALANLYAAGKMAEARAGMLEQAMDARGDLDSVRAQMKQNVVSELFLRDAQRPHIEKNTFVDAARAINHAYFLGMTPAYPVVNLTQIGVLLWPELSKRFGFVNSAKAIGRVTPTALKVLGAVWSEARKSGWKNLPDASINTQVLKAAGLSGSQADFIMRVVNSGILDIGSQSREIGRVVEGQQYSKLDNALRWASSFGYYSEMLSRLVAALSARELHGGYDEKMYQYVDDTVRQSMLSYETWNQARATGKLGLLGQYTPIMTSLMQYTFQLTEKLYREFHTGFMDSTMSKEEKAAARTFLGTHLAAIVALTGTLGMPMASVFAGVFDALANTLWKDDDDEPMNIRVAYRNWLTDVFGDTVGDMLARGVPRIAGVDISARAGEQDLLPYAHIFSKLLTDKREWKDKVAEDTFRSLGAPISMANSIISGGDQFLNGNYMDGLIEMMPPAIKGPLKAAKLSADGYTDQKGNKIPTMTPGTVDVLWQALGFNPANNAEYQESKNDQRILRGAMISKASQLRENLAKAIESGDMEAARDYMREAEAFDAKNPQFQVLKSIRQVLRSRAREREISSQSGAPLGVKPELADRTRYGIAN